MLATSGSVTDFRGVDTVKRTANHPPHLAVALCAFEDCTDRATYHNTPLCREHAAQVWKLVEQQEPTEYRQLVLGEVKPVAPKPRKSYRSNRPGHIYYLQVGDRVKIGFTTDLYRRMTEYPPNAVLLATHPGTPAMEKELHQDFRRYLADGREWFDPNPSLDTHLQKVLEKYPNTMSIAQMRQPRNARTATLRPAFSAKRV